MAKGFTPIIGLAVVVALAMAAVFGAMSLANPAMAAVGQPADAELTERTFSPQAAANIQLMAGETKPLSIGPLIDGGVGAIHATTAPTCSAYVPAGIVSCGTVARTSAVVEIPITAAAIIRNGRFNLTVTLVGDETVNLRIDVDVTAVAESTPATSKGSIMDMEVQQGTLGDDNVIGGNDNTEGPPSAVVKLAGYFTPGTGPDGGIVRYTVGTNDSNVEVAADAETPAFADRSSNALQTTTGNIRFRASSPTGDTNDGLPPVYDPSSVYVTVTAVDRLTGADPTQTFFVDIVAMVEEEEEEEAVRDATLPSFAYGSDGSGSTTDYSISFQIDEGEEVNTRLEDLIIEFHEDFTVPSSIGNTSVAVTTTGGDAARTFTPEGVTVDGNEVFISLGDMDEKDDVFDYDLSSNEKLTVHFRQSAGISNPTGAGDYGGVVAVAFGDAVDVDNGDEDIKTLAFNVPHSISIDPEDGGLGEEVTVKGKGFKNGTSLTVFRDMADHKGNVDNKLTSADDVLCTDDVVEGNIGVCTFEVTHPTFTAGATNRINAVDGVNDTAATKKTKVFELKASISTSPDGGSPGEMILVQVVDFKGTGISKVQVGGETYCGGKNPDGATFTCSGGVDQQGSGNFSIEIPNWARGGIQELKVWSNGGTSASTKITLLGPQIRLTRDTVVANQRISLIGTGFSPRSSIANVEDLPDGHSKPMISIGGDPIEEERINDGDPVRVDNGGNWSASVDLPLSEATTAAGKREIRVRDSLARTGVVEVIVLDREVTVTPDSGRVGTIAVVRGEGFPSKNDEGSNFTVEIEYEAANGNSITVSALTDASGRFETQLRIPTTAAIPSSNQIHVRFDDDENVTVPITVPHEVPEGIIQPSATSGGPGSTINISGEGFKSFVPISLVKIGTLDVTPSPKPSTDGNGMMEFVITIPGLDVGIQTIEVNAGRTTASVGFTVTESGINPGEIKEVRPALEDLGDNFVNIWHFNNDTKGWSFYDGEEGSDLSHLITGETYLLQIKSTVEVILNRDTRNLTCVGNNCWNQIVW